MSVPSSLTVMPILSSSEEYSLVIFFNCFALRSKVRVRGTAGRGKHVVVGLDIGEHAVACVGVLVIRKIRGSQPAYCLTKRPAVCESELVATEFTAFGGSPGFPVGTVETAQVIFGT